MTPVRKFVATGLALFAALFVVRHCTGCAANLARPAAYGAELEECNRTAQSCDESIACENLVRARYGRAPRSAKEGCTQ